MGIQDEPAKVRFLKDWAETGNIGAFRQPKPSRRRAESVDINVSADQHLSAGCGGRLLMEKGKQSVSRRAGNNLQDADITKLPKPVDQIAAALIDKEMAAFRKYIEIKLG